MFVVMLVCLGLTPTVRAQDAGTDASRVDPAQDEAPPGDDVDAGAPAGDVGARAADAEGHDGDEGNGREDTAPEDNAPEDNAPEDNAPEDNAPEDNAPEDEGDEGEGPDETGGDRTSEEDDASTDRPPTITFRAGDGLRITSADEQFRLRLGVRAQMRGTVTVPDGGDPQLEAAIRRARLNVGGHVFGRENAFVMQLAFSPEDLGLTPGGALTFTPLLDYYVHLRHLRDLEVLIGQYKRPFARERITSSGALSLVDRSIVDAALTLDRDLSVEVRSEDFLGLGWLRYYLGVGAGEGRDGGLGDQDFGLLYYARVEVLPLGLFDDHTQADLSRGRAPRLSLGFAYAFSHHGRGEVPLSGTPNADGGTTDYHLAAADFLLLWYGLTIEVDVIARYGLRDPGDAVDPLGNPVPPTLPSNGIGWFAQVSYLLPDVDLEIGARFGMNTPLGASLVDTAFRPEGELGGGLAYYFEGHAASLHLDYFHLWGDDFARGDERVRLQLELIL